MYVPLWLIVVVLAVALVAYVFFLQGRGGGEMIERQRRTTPPPPADHEKVLASPDVRAAIAQGHKIEAIRLVRERTGLGLKEAKDLVERGPGGSAR